MTDANRYEIIYRYAAGKVIGHLPVVGSDELLKELTRIKEEGFEILGVSKHRSLDELKPTQPL